MTLASRLLLRRRTALLLLGAAVLVAGCDGGQPPTYPVRGTVTFNGQPLQTGTVTFIPDPTGPYAIGQIDADGTYRLMTFVEGDGAVTGRHKVMVSAVLLGGEETAAQPLIPSAYGSPETSGLTAEVAETEENVVDLTLSSKPAPKAK